MIIDGREIVFRDQLYVEMARLETYIGQDNPMKGRKWISDLLDFRIDIVATNPFMYMNWIDRNTDIIYKRALFQRKYAIVYEVLTDRIDFITIYHTSQNPDAIDLGDAL